MEVVEIKVEFKSKQVEFREFQNLSRDYETVRNRGE